MMADYLLVNDDCLNVLKSSVENSFDAIVTDPPYDLVANKKGGSGVASINLNTPYGRARIGTGNGPGGFMGKSWDATGIAFDPHLWREALRVLKPGGHLLAFGGTRTYHRMACAIEDAGFEIRDSIDWVYGSGFPKSLDVAKAIDKAAGAERTEVVGRGKAGAAVHYGNPGGGGFGRTAATSNGIASTEWDVTAPATDAAKQWEGWGTALKPAHEPIVVARKPLVGTVAANVQQYGTGALNIDGCRVATTDSLNGGAYAKEGKERHDGDENWRFKREGGAGEFVQPAGRWPPNILLSHTPECESYQCLDPACPDAATYHDHPDRPDICAEDCAVAEMDRQSGTLKSGAPGVCRKAHETTSMSGRLGMTGKQETGYADSGGASRFFPVFRYQAKASRKERGTDNTHPTVKPVEMMRWLVRLVTPPGGVVLDPFMGSGTTGVAAIKEGFSFVGIEREAEYVAIAEARLMGTSRAEQP